MLKILQARLQQYVNRKLPDVQAGFRKGRGTKEKQGNSNKKIYFCFIDYTKAFDGVDHNELWKILQEMEISELLSFLLRILYAGQEATVRTGHGTTDWSQMEYVKGVYCHPVYLTCMQSISCEMPGWMKLKMESILLGEISVT